MANEMDAESVAHLTLEHLKYIRAGMDRVEGSVDDLRFRVGQIEETLTHHTRRFDRVDDRLKVIEKRLGLVDA